MDNPNGQLTASNETSVLDLATILRENLEQTVRRLGYEPNEKATEVRRLSLEGSWGYSSTVAKALARGPEAAQQEMAERILAAMPPHPLVARTEALRGFVNFYVDTSAFADRLLREVLAKGQTWGHGQPRSEQVMVEYAQPNTHKAVHVGHLRNIVLGNAVVRIMRAAGWPVLSATYPGDIGMHVIKCLWCYLRYHNGQEPEAGRGRWLSHVYAESDARLEYRKHLLALLGAALQDATLGPQLTDWLRGHGESEAEAREDVTRLLDALARSGKDDDPESAHEPDEDLGKDVDLSAVQPALIVALWRALGELLPGDAELRAEYDILNTNLNWWEQAPGWRDEVRELYQRWERQEPELMELWQRTRQWSLDEFADVYRTLDVEFDVEFFESQVEEEGRQIVDQLIAMGIAEDNRAEGEAVIVKIDQKLREHPLLREKYFNQLYKKAKNGDLTERQPYRVLVVLRSDGTTLYATKDLALARRKFEDYKVDRSIYVIDVRQGLYFSQVFKVLELWGFQQADQCYHLSYEMVGTKEGAFSSRKGNVPLYEDFEREAFIRARQKIDALEAQRETHEQERARQREASEDGGDRREPEVRVVSEEQKANIARIVALGALKYGMLDKDNNTFIAFDWDQALDFEQASAPYIMYAHARAFRVLEKAGSAPAASAEPLDFSRLQLSEADRAALANMKDLAEGSPERRRIAGLNNELTLLDLISRYPEDIDRAAVQYNPVLLTTYLFRLAEALNKFYNTCRILNAETDALRRSRLALTAAARQTLANGLGLLGIAAPEVM